jgi:hypothetical protein
MREKLCLDEITVSHYKAFAFGNEACETGSRFGGVEPEAIEPYFRNEFTRYLMTLQLSKYWEVSVFCSFDYSLGSQSDPYDLAHTMFSQDNPLVQVCFHHPSQRRVMKKNENMFAEASLGMSDVFSKEGDYEEPNIYPFHKIGGLPFFTREFDTTIAKECEELLDDSFTHLVQLAFPMGPTDSAIDIDWPFGDTVFHVFTKVVGDEIVYKYCWG